MKKVFWGIAVIVVIVLVGLGAWYFTQSSTSFSGTPDSITIGSLPIETNGLIYVAEDQGFFAKNGLNVTIKGYSMGTQAIAGMENGDVDISSSAEYPIVVAAFQKQNVSIIGNIDKYQIMSIVCRNDRGIGNYSDLNGKKIGVAKGAIAEFYLGRFLDLCGISIQNVTLVNIPTNDQAVDAILNGSVDAVVIPNNNIGTLMGHVGGNPVIWPVQNNQSAYDILAGRNEWIDTHPESINNFLRSLDQAEHFTIDHPDEAKAIIQKRLNYSDEYMATVWLNHQFSLTLDQSLVVAMKGEGRWMIANNLTGEKTIPNYRDYIYTKGMLDVKPELVDIF